MYKGWLPRGFEFLSGLPERLRRERLIVTFQAWFDDSGTKGDGIWMVVAGLFGKAEVFAEVADQWERCLTDPYPGQIQYFKMYEACNLVEQFNYWNDGNRDFKVRQLAKIIDRDDLLVLSARLDLRAFEAVSPAWAHVKPKRHHSMSEPYMLLYQGTLTTAVEEALRRDQKQQMEIVYDDQDWLRQSIVASYPEWREGERGDPTRYAVMPVQPGFRNDKDWVVLQAADLIAGDRRIGLLPEAEQPPFHRGLFKHLRLSGLCKDLGVEEMKDIHVHLLESLKREQEKDGGS